MNAARQVVAARIGRATLRVLDELNRERLVAPTVEELADALELTKSTVHSHLVSLRSLGLVEWDDHKSRTLRITPNGRRAAL